MKNVTLVIRFRKYKTKGFGADNDQMEAWIFLVTPRGQEKIWHEDSGVGFARYSTVHVLVAAEAYAKKIARLLDAGVTKEEVL